MIMVVVGSYNKIKFQFIFIISRTLAKIAMVCNVFKRSNPPKKKINVLQSKRHYRVLKRVQKTLAHQRKRES